jgi:hypothetical protein
VSSDDGHFAALLINAAAEADRLLPLVDDQHRRAAELRLAGERDGHTLPATADRVPGERSRRSSAVVSHRNVGYVAASGPNDG